MAKKKGWWSQPVFSSPTAKNTKPASASGKNTKRVPKQKIEKCGICKKPWLQCKCSEVKPASSKEKKDEPRKKYGVELCGACNYYLFANGVCRNAQCSTRR